MSSTEQLYVILILAAFAGFIALAAFLSLSDYLYDRRRHRQPFKKGDVLSIHPGAKAA